MVPMLVQFVFVDERVIMIVRKSGNRKEKRSKEVKQVP